MKPYLKQRYNRASHPYGCKNGACGSCKGKVLEGQVEHGQHGTALARATGTVLTIEKGDALFSAAQVGLNVNCLPVSASVTW